MATIDYIFIGIITSILLFNVYKEHYPTLEDLKERKKLRDNPSYGSQIGRFHIDRGQKQAEWEERCLAANKILKY